MVCFGLRRRFLCVVSLLIGATFGLRCTVREGVFV